MNEPQTQGPSPENPGEIPQSQTLAEANPESLGDLMSRDPEGFQKQDIMRGIEAYRAMREKWEIMEKTEGAKPKKERTKADAQAILKRASGSAGDLGL